MALLSAGVSGNIQLIINLKKNKYTGWDRVKYSVE